LKKIEILVKQLKEEASPDKKVIFLSGGPGSGKTFFAKKALLGLGMKYVNPDILYKLLQKKKNEPINHKEMTPEQKKKSDKAHTDVGRKTMIQVKNLIKNERSFILDTTGRSFDRTINVKKELEKNGYKTLMVLVFADKKTSYNRNDKRERSVTKDFLDLAHNAVKRNIEDYKEEFGSNFVLIDNSNEFDENKEKEWNRVWVRVKSWLFG
jgi:dephospho-CoA kinase